MSDTDDLKFPDWSGVPQDPPKGMPMDQYLEFVLFCLKTFSPKKDDYGDMPAPVRFVIRDDDEPYSKADSRESNKK